MFRSLAFAALIGVAVLGSAGDAKACFGLLNGGGGCNSCCEPCCDAGPRCCLFGGLRGMFHRHHGCCETSCCEEASCGCEETTCCEEPSCEAEASCGCEADCCCEPCCKPRCCILGKLRGMFHRNSCCCEASCGCEEPSCGCGG